MKQILLNHRTIREYSPKKIEKEKIHELLEAAIRASTTGNMQLYSIVATTQNEIKELLAPCHFNQPMVKNAPLILTFCADFNRFNKWCEERNAKPGYNNFHSFFTAAIDALLVAQNFCIAAESEGLGICYLGTTTYTAEKIIEVLCLPKFVIPVTTITIGYPINTPPKQDRLPIEAVLHQEFYSDYTAEKIRLFYHEKESLPENKKFTQENHKETLAQVFTDIRYKKSDNEHFTKQFVETLKKQGFQFDFKNKKRIFTS